MELEKFEEAKKVKEDLDRLERQKRKLESALKACKMEVIVAFTHGAFMRKDQVNIMDDEIVNEMLTKELERVTKEIEIIKEEFEKI